MTETSKTLQIAGNEYPLVTMDAFTMDDAVVLYEYSGLTLEDFIPPDPDDEDEEAKLEEIAHKIRNPGVLAALVHVSYQRGNPTVKKDKVKRIVGATPLMDIYESLADEDDDDEVPPPEEPTSEPSEASGPVSLGSNGSSGHSSASTSDAPEPTLPPTTDGKSGTSSVSDPVTSAA